MADCLVAQSWADLSKCRLAVTASAAMRSSMECAGLYLARCKERPHPMVNDHGLGLERPALKPSYFRFPGGRAV